MATTENILSTILQEAEEKRGNYGILSDGLKNMSSGLDGSIESISKNLYIYWSELKPSEIEAMKSFTDREVVSKSETNKSSIFISPAW